jgi:hypothetical protein
MVAWLSFKSWRWKLRLPPKRKLTLIGL